MSPGRLRPQLPISTSAPALVPRSTKALAVLGFALLSCAPGCAPGRPLAEPDEHGADRKAGIDTAESVRRAAVEYRERAAVLEPATTPMMQELAAAVGGKLVGLEHRFKSQRSLERKIDLKMSQQGIAAGDVAIDDALRYTVLLDDDPPGHYTKGVHDTLAALEQRGHRVHRVKNYWPRGDNYSGVNTVLEADSGLLWEVQFHTTLSMTTQKKDHIYYEELRERTTSVERKRELFDQMAAPWYDIPVPENALEPGAMHAIEEIIQHPRP